MKIETIAAQAAHKVDPATGVVTLPIQLSTTFERDPDGQFSRGFIYSRNNNPNRQTLEECLSNLEGGAAAAAFSSGSAATAGVFQALFPGDHVIAPMIAITASPTSCATYSPLGAWRPLSWT
jgi:cystathionine gamma-synthase